ncbi:MAG TPA: alkaline phosphatase family protein [Polyangia bacterium]|nr:alkaline phosphatase family protein [Polyangia bacterium]
MFRTIRRASLLTILSSAAFVVGSCGGERSPSTASNSATGSVDIALVQGGVTINSVNYTINGPANFSKSGTIDVSQSATLSTIIGGLPAGNGYTITLTATGTDGTSCGGSATFNVTAGAVTKVSVTLECHQPAKTGSISVTGTLNVCPNLDALSASPAEVAVGATLSVSATADDPDNGPSPLAYSWTASSGVLKNANTASPTFECTSTGPATITVSVSDGDPLATCAAQGSLQVTCSGHNDAALAVPTATPIKHLVVVFGENISYDHYFGTYPNAAGFTPAAGTPINNNLVTPLDVTNGFAPLSGLDLLHNNPVAANTANGTGAVNPFLLSGPAQAFTADQGHNYKPEQQASDNGAMDLFPEFTGTAGPPPGAPAAASTKGLAMAYYDATTVSTYWNLAQTYAMSDNSWTTVFGPSTPGAINLIAGQTNGFLNTNRSPTLMSASHVTPDGNGGWTMIGDTDPLGDVCSTSGDQNNFAGKNIGDLLNAKGLTWGWFEGGFDLTVTNANGTTGCARETDPTVPFPSGDTSADYIPHHQPFQYYPSTANLTHARPTGTIGATDAANHQYDTHDFFDALKAGNLPVVTYLKAPAFEDGHPGYSDPIDEQNFINQVLAAIQGSQEWTSTAVVFAYDDSDGWYDHQAPPIVNQSNGVADALNGAGVCNHGAQQTGAAPATMLLGNDGNPALGRCGYGTRVPLVVVSPYSKKNYIDHTLTDQSSVLKFVEDNWLGGQRIQAGGSFDTIAGPINGMFNF